MPSPLTTRFLFTKQQRLLRSSEFDQVFQLKHSAANKWLVVYCKKNEQGHARLGLVVSRKVGNAVVRNRWKRRLRESFRLLQHELPAVDLVCIPRSKSVPDLSQLLESFPKVVARAMKRC